MMGYQAINKTSTGLARVWPVSLLGFALVLSAAAAAAGATGLSTSGVLDLRLHPGDLQPTVVVPQPDLSGNWVLDQTHSDDPKHALQAAAKGGERPPQSRGGQAPAERKQGPWLENGAGAGSGDGPRGGGGMGGGKQGRGEGADPERLAGAFPQRLEIRQQETMITITTPPGRTRRITTDDRGASVSGAGAFERSVMTGRWQGATLRIETTSAEDGQTIVERFRLLAQPRRLELITTLPVKNQNGEAIDVKQIFIPNQKTSEHQGPGGNPDR